MAGDRVTLIPKTAALKIRVGKTGEPVNLGLTVTLDTPRFDMDLGGREIARDIAERYALNLSAKFAQGFDAHGRALKAISQETRERRQRRQRQREDQTGAKGERFLNRARGREHSYRPVDDTTPMHESGLFADGVVVTHIGTRTGDPIFGIAFPLGGGARMRLDDGRGARLHALQHYGIEEMIGLPSDMDAEVDARLHDHLNQVLRAVGSLRRLIGGIREVVEDVTGIVGEEE